MCNDAHISDRHTYSSSKLQVITDLQPLNFRQHGYLMCLKKLDMCNRSELFIDRSCSCCKPRQLLGKSKEALLYH
jgi:hypothetical protein